MRYPSISQDQQVPSPAAPTPAPGGAVQTAAPTSPTGLLLEVPTDFAGVATLRAQRSELSRQLISAANRREELSEELQTAPVASRAGIQARIDQLDGRILRIEADIDATGLLLTRTSGTLLGGQGFSDFGSPGGPRMDVTAVSIVFTIFVLMPLAVTFARNMWRRGSTAKTDSVLERQNADRLGRLESAVDAVAIEMERVSEGQRFVTKLLAESAGRDKVRIEAPQQ